MIAAEAPEILILDGREGPSRPALEKLKRQIAVTAVVDDGSERRLAADYAYYPPGSRGRWNWAGRARGIARCPASAWEWSLLGLNPNARVNRSFGARPTLLVTMGGSDPLGLTERAAQALSGLCSTFRIRFVIGSGMADGAKVAARITARRRNYETVEGADDLSTEYANADMALCAFGVTAYELAAHGVPAVYLGLTEDHARSASAFAEAGMGVSLGVAGKVSDDDIMRAVQTLMYNASARRRMHNMGLSLIDGQGAARIAADLSGSAGRGPGADQGGAVIPLPATERTHRPSRRAASASRTYRMARRVRRSGPARSSLCRKESSRSSRPRPPPARIPRSAR